MTFMELWGYVHSRVPSECHVHLNCGLYDHCDGRGPRQTWMLAIFNRTRWESHEQKCAMESAEETAAWFDSLLRGEPKAGESKSVDEIFDIASPAPIFVPDSALDDVARLPEHGVSA